MFLHQLSNSLSLTTPTDLPAPVANGYSNSDRWSLKARTLTPPRDRISQDSESEDSYLQVSSLHYQPFSLSRLTGLLSVGVSPSWNILYPYNKEMFIGHLRKFFCLRDITTFSERYKEEFLSPIPCLILIIMPLHRLRPLIFWWQRSRHWSQRFTPSRLTSDTRRVSRAKPCQIVLVRITWCHCRGSGGPEESSTVNQTAAGRE